MKKWLYMLLGLVVTLGSVWMGKLWWEHLKPFMIGLLVVFVFMAGIIILIVSFMIPAKEEDMSDFSCDSEDSTEETEDSALDETGCTGNCDGGCHCSDEDDSSSTKE